MRTRRSVKNQNILWRELGGRPPEKVPQVHETIESVKQMLLLPHINKRYRRELEKKLEFLILREKVRSVIQL